ncbi:MAG TPA: L,D-transpeptidase [Hyphomicrobium sp.]|jgi:lipoprotein-anchoring transpeptidase ErfK/SrfK|nr:L,D-transpeptidase [Hyphomicrobium sp.]
MLRARSLVAALVAILPAIPAAAQQSQPNKIVAAANDASSGTTTDFSESATKPEAPAEPAAKPKQPLRPTLTASIDLASQRMVVKVDGQTRYSWPISSGVAAYATPTGTFRPQRTEKMWYSRKYDMAPMPHAVFIHGGVAIHGTSHTAYLGSPASHGCIRLSKSHAATFYSLVKQHGMARTRVSVYGRPHWRKGSQIAGRDDDNRRSRYADRQGSWFWGDSESAYDYRPSRRKIPKGYAYVDGQLVKVYRRKNGDYVYRRASRRDYDNYD